MCRIPLCWLVSNHDKGYYTTSVEHHLALALYLALHNVTVVYGSFKIMEISVVKNEVVDCLLRFRMMEQEHSCTDF